jgi:hypothetical protein
MGIGRIDAIVARYLKRVLNAALPPLASRRCVGNAPPIATETKLPDVNIGSSAVYDVGIAVEWCVGDGSGVVDDGGADEEAAILELTIVGALVVEAVGVVVEVVLLVAVFVVVVDDDDDDDDDGGGPFA